MTRGFKGGLIAWCWVFLFFVALALPYNPGVRSYSVKIPETFSKTSPIDQGILAKAWVEETVVEVGDIDTFLALSPRTSYLLPKIENDYLKLHYLGKTSEGAIIHAVWKDSWWRAYRTTNATLNVEETTLNILVAPDWTEFFFGGIFLGAVLAAILGIVVGSLLSE